MQISEINILAKYLVAGVLILAVAFLAQDYVDLEREKVLVRLKETQGVLTTARCADNLFQEVNVVLPDGGGYHCGAVRELPVEKKELARWYQKEAERWFEATGRK